MNQIILMLLKKIDLYVTFEIIFVPHLTHRELYLMIIKLVL